MCHIIHFDSYFCDRCLVWEPSYELPTHLLFILRQSIVVGSRSWLSKPFLSKSVSSQHVWPREPGQENLLSSFKLKVLLPFP